MIIATMINPVHADGLAPGSGVASGHFKSGFASLDGERADCWFDHSRYAFGCKFTSAEARANRQADTEFFARTLGRNLNRMCDRQEASVACVAKPLSTKCRFVRFSGFSQPIPCFAKRS
jgi:hypothetical protein